MSGPIEDFLKDFISSWQMARIYETGHPKFTTSLEQARQSLEAILKNKAELAIGVFGEELASGDQIFFDLSKRMLPAINYLKEREIERIIFRSGVTAEELVRFVSFLLSYRPQAEVSPQEHLARSGVKHISVGKLKTPQKKEGVQSDQAQGGIAYYKSCLNEVTQSLDALLNQEEVDSLNLRFAASNIMDNLSGHYQIFFKLTAAKRYDVATFIHLLNVSSLSMYLCSRLGFSRPDCLNVGIAGIFHDIGKLYIAKNILQKASKLVEKEFDRIKSHTVLGAEILLEYVDVLTILPAVVAFEHHLGYDLKGYPRISFPRKLHIASLIVAVCDVYDALTQRRSYKNDYPPELIYRIMSSDRGKKFSPEVLDQFFRVMGVWPPGTLVVLSDGRVAIVREANETDIFLPRVEVVTGSSRGRVDLTQQKGVKIDHSLNPLSDGREYVDLI